MANIKQETLNATHDHKEIPCKETSFLFIINLLCVPHKNPISCDYFCNNIKRKTEFHC